MNPLSSVKCLQWRLSTTALQPEYWTPKQVCSLRERLLVLWIIHIEAASQWLVLFTRPMIPPRFLLPSLPLPRGLWQCLPSKTSTLRSAKIPVSHPIGWCATNEATLCEWHSLSALQWVHCPYTNLRTLPFHSVLHCQAARSRIYLQCRRHPGVALASFKPVRFILVETWAPLSISSTPSRRCTIHTLMRIHNL